MAWFRYGYFVRQPDGSIVPAGDSFCPTPDSCKVGDSLGVRGDEEGFVIGILKGREAKLGGTKFSAVGKNLHKRPLNESFYDFQVHHLLWHLGKEWFDDEMKKPLEERHIILQWRSERAQQFRKYQDPRNPDANVRAPSTGGMRALQVLAD